MATPARRLQSLVCIVLIILFLGLKEAIGEGAVKENARLIGERNEVGRMYCCHDYHIGKCVPGTWDDLNCHQLCLRSQCQKGGFCKILIDRKPPNHFCHCTCIV
ncbi:hypothetical protein VNO77_05313 [Canavalia gladiata]|uniref:Uncharacterized protein n=1 Tax=Canavalia gladiata TaxID=3824 RepID=A0AAN9R8J3_CANGL